MATPTSEPGRPFQKKPVLECKKQAVIVIHGIGEQRPMETLRSFVDAVWVKSPKVQSNRKDELGHNVIWFMPDDCTGSLELRRITTAHFKDVRTDFFELYWADLMEGTTTQQLWAWITGLLLRSPKRVPRTVFSAWIALWILSLVTVGLFFWSGFGSMPAWLPHADAPAWRLVPLAVSAGLGFVIHSLLVPYLGDISRYVRAAPDTIAGRQAVRDRGTKLLEGLHESGRYRRIIFVAHSLGCIIAYDLISQFWASHGPTPDHPPGPKTLAALEAIDAYLAPGRTFAIEEYRDAQRAVFDAMRAENANWLISDFVTIGCPLTHAAFLLAPDEAGVEQAKRERFLPVSPPLPDNPDKVAKGAAASLLYALTREVREDFDKTRTRKAGEWFPHHSAPFAAVRWTNIYDPPRNILFGDLVSGPLRHLFGEGIEEREVKISRPFLFGSKWSFFTHTLYWDLENAAKVGATQHIEELRAALALDQA
jgi:hypothetical protein